MSYIRISEFARRPQGVPGEWYAPRGSDGSVRLDRGEATAFAPPQPGPGSLLTTWSGVRVYQGGAERMGSLVYLLKYPVPLEYQWEFEAWFVVEHMPMLLEEATWYGCEFFRALGPSGWSFAALQYVDPLALTSDARNRSVDTPWWHRLKQHEWFDKQFERQHLTPL